MTPEEHIESLEDVEDDEALKLEELLAQQAFQIKRLEQQVIELRAVIRYLEDQRI